MAQGKITINTITHKIVTADGEEHTLRSKEYQMLCLLLERAPLCVTRREIISHVWSGTYSADATINQTMKSIRRKLGDKDFTLIQTIPRMGYQIEHPELFSLEPAVNHEPVIHDDSREDQQLNTQSHYESKRDNVQTTLPVINENQSVKRWGMMVAIGILCFICGVLWHGMAPSFPLLTKTKGREEISNSLISTVTSGKDSTLLYDNYRFVCKYSWHDESQFALVCTKVELPESNTPSR
ncbi:winged helix-turn-helix domain-containing protein [Hafnia alvei]|uniref:Transcriptional regulatory protein, C terminal n=1 Tax=Hafnia alvei TaxID=569 RepID=A0A1C6YYS9_HAFAL|nr:winged helix-turn-helix domain-containing protein [Hafnia alvei]NLS52455.1 winged helix family transcriptional regulator [Hafnia alvei]SCM51959.1 Transcriptional regulatory protein, C terminal [Hafnia alvei]